MKWFSGIVQSQATLAREINKAGAGGARYQNNYQQVEERE